jgi:HD-GYP domain-containing protein (c-di-GMP phosphodiesterase class II)
VILEDLKIKEGSYISGHSLMVANVGCALAYRAGWTSAPTLFKICLAAFLHDISLHHEVMARIRSMDEVRSVGLDVEQVKELRLHPIRAGEYARQFSEIPTEVEQIVIQHHERPDGSGFPRGLNATQISPLGALFIIAEDLVHEALEDSGITVNSFFEKRAAYYSRGQFKKIATAVRGG